MVIVSCSVNGCQFRTEDVSEALAIALLTNHGLAHQSTQSPAGGRSSSTNLGPKLERPKIDIGVSIEEWNIFVRRWEVFKCGSQIDDTAAPSQLFQCANNDLGDSLLKSDPAATSKPLSDLLNAMKALAVIPVAKGVLRTELLQLQQQRDESFRAFASRVRGKAETCSFSTACTCGLDVDYTDHVIRDVLLSGMVDPDIRRDVLGIQNLLSLPINDIVALVETKEMARNALPNSSVSAVSSFARQRKSPTPRVSQTPSGAEHARRASCPDCRKMYNLFSEGSNGWNSKPHQVCIDCFRIRRRKRQNNMAQGKASVHAVECNPISQVAGIQAQAPRDRKHVALAHHIFSSGEWKRARLRDHPRVSVHIAVDIAQQKKYGCPGSSVSTSILAVADSGAQSNLWSLKEFLRHGFNRDDLIPVTMGLSAANHSRIPLEGAFFATIESLLPTRQTVSCRSMIYVTDAIDILYLSYDTMLDLNLLIRTAAPKIAANTNTPLPSGGNRELHDGCPDYTPGIVCKCPKRTPVPTRPITLPFEPCEANNDRMKKWLLDRFTTSTFNTCAHSPLPQMDGPPIEIHIDPSAKPKACHTPANIPLHWQERVHEDMLRDERLGVIERVPFGEPVLWCHRMVVTRKHDGSPRRTVDLSPLNKFCQRETFSVESPFHLARRIPKNTWKTVTDAWNGYHSVPLRPQDRQLTTFITPFGRWRYLRAPQGFLSSGDGYNRRFDSILLDFERKERCVDDTIHFDESLATHWWRTIDFLTLVGQAGIVLNPEKFQFASKQVDFAGFRISDSSVEPLPKFLDAIREFPVPQSTTDIRSWFGLVNQVANYGQLRDTMTPFRPFLSPRCPFQWTPELEIAFQTSKDTIVESIRHGVEIFDIKKRTCLRPDWSCRGIGYFLLQQHCQCKSGFPNCCENGWHVTLAGSRFLSAAEERYAAIEGEALAVAWGLEQTRYFTQGCDDLLVITDHKPLVKIFGDRTLDEISNSRLFRLKQRTLMWRFTIAHLPGQCNQAADATSRHPSSLPSNNIISSSIPDIIEANLVAAIHHEVTDCISLSWSTLAAETEADPAFCRLTELINSNFKSWDDDNDDLTGFWPLRDGLYIQDGVIMYQDRVVVPPSLRKSALQTLHAAHQGTTTMEQRARTVIFWPGMTNDIRQTRLSCRDCNRNAPSQVAPPPMPSIPPSTPFESIFADFFDYAGRHYLVIGDRLSGWVEVLGATSGTDYAGANGLIRHLRAFFATFGVPEELSSDGGPEFSSGATESFLRTWGIKHRISSAYFPQSNGRAEVAVKTAKRLLMSSTGPTGNLNHDKFLQAMMQLRNTPDPDCCISPAEIIFGRPIRDAFSFLNRLEKYSNPNVRPLWRRAWEAKEEALRCRMIRTSEALKQHTRPCRPLKTGERVFIQNQTGPNRLKWDKSGIVVEALLHDQYLVRVDGSRRITRRNRRFLRAFSSVSSEMPITSSSHTLPIATDDCATRLAVQPQHAHQPVSIINTITGSNEKQIPLDENQPVLSPSTDLSNGSQGLDSQPVYSPQRPHSDGSVDSPQRSCDNQTSGSPHSLHGGPAAMSPQRARRDRALHSPHRPQSVCSDRNKHAGPTEPVTHSTRRSGRVRQGKKFYEPESGLWVEK